MSPRRDHPVPEAEILRADRCSRCSRQVVWCQPAGFSARVALDVASREKDGISGQWRLEVHAAHCPKGPAKPRKRFGGHRSVGSGERSFD